MGIGAKRNQATSTTLRKHHRIPPGCNQASYSAGQCTYSDTWSQNQVPTENYNLMGDTRSDWASDWQVSGPGKFLRSKAQQSLDQETPSAAATRESLPVLVSRRRLPVRRSTTIPSTTSFPAEPEQRRESAVYLPRCGSALHEYGFGGTD